MPVGDGGFRQSCNTQNVTSEDGLIIATEVTTDPGDVTWFEPMLEKAQKAAGYIASHAGPPPPPTGPAPGPPGPGHQPGHAPRTAPAAECWAPAATCLIALFVTDSGYLSERNLTCPGPDRLIATGKRRDLEKNTRDPHAAAPEKPSRYAEARRRRHGRTPPEQKKASPPTASAAILTFPHGHIKHNTGIRQFGLRGLPKVTAEWNLITAVRNLRKAITSGHLTAQALTTL